MNDNHEINIIATYVNGNAADVEVFEIGGHEYIVASRCRGGTSIIHSESCPCKNAK